MRGCLTFIITAIILVAFGGTALPAIVVLVPILLGDQDAESLADLHWYTWGTIILLPIILLKLLVKMSRLTSNYICDMLGIDWKDGILTEECHFLLSVLFCNKHFVILSKDTASCCFIDIQNSEAKCFILTKREPENSLSAKADMIVKVGNVVQLFPRYYSADFCHIPPSRFLRTSVAEYRHEVCAF